MIQIPEEIVEVYKGNIPIESIYNGNKLLFENSKLICFSNGFWVDEFFWDDNSYWMD